MSCCQRHDLSQGISERMTKELKSASIVRRLVLARGTTNFQGIGEQDVVPQRGNTRCGCGPRRASTIWPSSVHSCRFFFFFSLFRTVTSRHASDLAHISTIVSPHCIFQISAFFFFFFFFFFSPFFSRGVTTPTSLLSGPDAFLLLIPSLSSSSQKKVLCFSLEEVAERVTEAVTSWMTVESRFEMYASLGRVGIRRWWRIPKERQGRKREPKTMHKFIEDGTNIPG